ncbi:MAG: HD domain-containing phosphohydrolase [Anaerolineales bacterium]
MNQTLLVVEDNLTLLEGLRDILSMEGFTVLTASNGEEALQQMGSTSPDMIISDIAMPVMDGFSFFQSVRSKPDWLTIPFLFLTARNDREHIMEGKNLGAEDYLVKPLSRDELLTAVRTRLARSEELRSVRLQQAYEASLTMLANAIDLRDPYTRGHIERVTAYSIVLATQLGWSETQIELLRFGAILHDIGKIFIHEAMLFKSKPLDREDWFEIKRHPVAGADMIKDVPYLARAVPVVRHHHERWDGSGYPDGLKGQAIPAPARIVALADAFDAITIDRPYRSARTPQQAYEEIVALKGTQFDPDVVDAFQRLWENRVILSIWESWHSTSR